MFYAKNSETMDNIDRLLDAAEHPERYTDAELDSILQDPDAREAYDLMSKTRGALFNPAEPDIDAEWQRFAATRIVSPRCSRFLTFVSRHAAALIIGAASLTMVAAGIGIGVSPDRDDTVAVTEATANDSGSRESATATDDTIPANEPQTVIFKENSLSTILESIASYYGATLVSNKPEAKDLRLYFIWDQSKPLDETIDMLNNFEQIDITLKDNTIIVD